MGLRFIYWGDSKTQVKKPIKFSCYQKKNVTRNTKTVGNAFMDRYNVQKIIGAHFVNMICVKGPFVFMTMTISKKPTVYIVMEMDNVYQEFANAV
jgi:predicted ATPase